MSKNSWAKYYQGNKKKKKATIWLRKIYKSLRR